MSSHLIQDAKMVLAGKSARLDDEELEYLAQEITKLGFKLRFARAYAAGPTLIVKMIRQLESYEEQLNKIRMLIGCKS